MAHPKMLFPRSEKVSLRVYPMIKAALVNAAERRGLTLTEYIEPLILNALQKDGENLNINVNLVELMEAKRA
jgi:uncharacterized protein (DUF1778 family)